jgi:hypothetical protein
VKRVQGPLKDSLELGEPLFDQSVKLIYCSLLIWRRDRCWLWSRSRVRCRGWGRLWGRSRFNWLRSWSWWYWLGSWVWWCWLGRWGWFWVWGWSRLYRLRSWGRYWLITWRHLRLHYVISCPSAFQVQVCRINLEFQKAC